MATEQTFYYERADGTVEERVTTDAVPEHPPGVTLLSAAEYAAKLETIQEARQARLNVVQEEERAAKQAAYEELRASGISDAVAQSLSGYSPPVSDPGGEPETVVVG